MEKRYRTKLEQGMQIARSVACANQSVLDFVRVQPRKSHADGSKFSTSFTARIRAPIELRSKTTTHVASLETRRANVDPDERLAIL